MNFFRNFFSFKQELAMDLGTANTIILQHGEIVVNEPSYVALERLSGKTLAVGMKAKLMGGKTPPQIQVERPLRDGVIADFQMRMVIGVPSGSTNVDLRSVRDSAERAGGREVLLIYEPMAAAIGCGIDVNAPDGNMIVDIGGGTTEIAVISLGDIVTQNSINVAGDELTNDIQQYMSRQHNIKVDERMAESIKINVGSALTDLGEDEPDDYVVHGPNKITSLPMEVPVCYQEIAHCLDRSIAHIEQAIINALEATPPGLYADIVHNGIYLTGGGAMLRGLARRLEDKINIKFIVAEDPLLCVAKGTGIALENVENFTCLMK